MAHPVFWLAQQVKEVDPEFAPVLTSRDYSVVYMTGIAHLCNLEDHLVGCQDHSCNIRERGGRGRH